MKYARVLMFKPGPALYDRYCRICGQRWFISWRIGSGGWMHNRFCICRVIGRWLLSMEVN